MNEQVARNVVLVRAIETIDLQRAILSDDDRMYASRSAALVCTDGMPAAAQRTLLMQLASAGAELQYHGDFDWPGIGIANVVMRQFGAQPWRFGVQDYCAATATAGVDRRPLGPATVNAQWDPALTAEMIRCDRAIDEEAVAPTLLADLALDC